MKKRKLEILALIPARGGSRRVKNKNARLLGGKPLLTYTVNAALGAKLVTRVLITTDNARIAALGRKAGAEAPFLRPARLARPDSTELEFHAHALAWLEKHEGYSPDLIVNLYPTSPFRRAATIDRAIKAILASPDADSLRSVRPVSEHPHKMWVKKGGGRLLEPFIASKKKGNQALAYHLLPEVFIQNASIYITRPRTLKNHGSTVGKKVLCFEMSEEESVDINTPLDFKFAEACLRWLK